MKPLYLRRIDNIDQEEGAGPLRSKDIWLRQRNKKWVKKMPPFS
jgi:hypothetical protein